MSGRPTSTSGSSPWSSTNATWTPSSGSIRASRDRLAERKTNNWAEVPYHGAPALFYSRSSPYNRHSPHLRHVRGELSRGRPPARQPVPLFACRGHWQRVRDCGFLRGGAGIPLTSRTTYKKFPTRPLFGRAHSYARIAYGPRGRTPPISYVGTHKTLPILLCGRSSSLVGPTRYRGVGKRACSANFLEEFFSETQLTLPAKRRSFGSCQCPPRVGKHYQNYDEDSHYLRYCDNSIQASPWRQEYPRRSQKEVERTNYYGGPVAPCFEHP